MNSEEQSKRLELLLRGKTVRTTRMKPRELLIEFDDGLLLFVNISGDELDLSVTAGPLGGDH